MRDAPVKLPTLMTADGRRAYAFAAILGGCGVMTGFAAYGVWLVSGNAKYSFYLALAAHAQILVGMTLLGALFVQRSFKVGRDGVEITDDAVRDGDTVTIKKDGE